MKVEVGSFTKSADDDQVVSLVDGDIGATEDWFILVSSRSSLTGGNAAWRTTNFTGDSSKRASASAGRVANFIQGQAQGQFTVGTGWANGVVCDYLAIEAHASDCAIGTLTGDGEASQVIGSLGIGQVAVVGGVMPDTTTGVRYRSAGHASAVSAEFVENYDSSDGIIALGDSSFTVGIDLNATGVVYDYIAWPNIAAFAHTDTWTGDSVDGRDLTFTELGGETPAWATVGRISEVTKPIGKGVDNTGDSSNFFDGTGAAANHVQDFIVDGVDLGTSVNVNQSTLTYTGWFLVAGDSQGGAPAEPDELLASRRALSRP
jgi:hypothetical protein